MNKSEPIGEWLKRQGRVHIRYGDAIELIQEIQAKRDNLGLELSEWVNFGDEVIGMVCDLFDIEEPNEKMNELKKWKEWIRKEHQYYDANRDKITRLEAIEERDRILELCPEAKDILGFIDRAHMKWKEGTITKDEYEYIKETRTFPPYKGPYIGGWEFWLCHECGLIVHEADTCPLCRENCWSGKNQQLNHSDGKVIKEVK